MFRTNEDRELESKLLASTDAEKKEMEAMKLQAAIAERQRELRKFSEQEKYFTTQVQMENFRKRCHAIMKSISGYQDQLEKLVAGDNDRSAEPRGP